MIVILILILLVQLINVKKEKGSRDVTVVIF